MLFDLSSPGRKNVIRVVYGVLALLFLVGFVGFGIGGELGGGGIIDSITGNGGSDTADQYEQQIEDAEATLESDPTNERALVELTRYRYLSGQAQLEVDETGTPVALTEESRSEFEAAIEMWERYLATDPKNPDVTATTNIVLAYQFLNDLEGAARTQEILAEERPSVNAYATLAYYRYSALDLKGGDEATELALAEAKPGEQKAIEKQLTQIRDAAEKQQKQNEKLPDNSAGAEAGLESPFGGLSPSGGSVPPAAP